MTKSYTRLFIVTPLRYDPDDLLPVLTAAIAGGDIASLLVRHEDVGQLQKAAELFTPLAQQNEIAVLIEGDAKIAESVGADGVEVGGDGHELKGAREALSADQIVGVYCDDNRHEAMAAGEAGADYVAFSFDKNATDKDQIGFWWATVMEVPCVIGDPLDEAQAEKAISKGVEFICPDQSMWESADEAKKTIARFNKLIKDTPLETV